MEEIKKIFEEGDYTCVIKNRGEIKTFTKQGVTDLLDLYQNNKTFLKGAIIVDKAVGKAAAALMIAGDVKSVYTKVISENALKIFNVYDIDFTYDEKIPYVKNRDNTDLCPLEKLTQNEKSVQKIVKIIRNFYKMLDNNQ